MRKNKAALLLEIILAMIFIGILANIIVSFVLFTGKNKEKDYRFVALNLAREVLEFGEGAEYTYGKTSITCWKNRIECGGANGRNTPCGTCCCSKICGSGYSYQLVYKYNAGAAKYVFDPTTDFQFTDISDTCDDTWQASALTLAEATDLMDDDGEEAAGKTVEEILNLGISPFSYMGDIKAKGMVPEPNPDSVVITYTVDGTAPHSINYRKHTVVVSWKDADDQDKSIVLGTVPLNKVNNAYRLKISEFSWKK